MKAQVGDRIVVAPRTTGGARRDAEIMEVHGADGSPPYVVRWGDSGNIGLFFPGIDAHVVDAHQVAAPGAGSSAPSEPVAASTRGDDGSASSVTTRAHTREDT